MIDSPVAVSSALRRAASRIRIVCEVPDGGTVTIRSRLQDHLAGRAGACTQRATHYWREATTSPVTREVELQEAYKAKHGKLPRCNERVG